MPRAKKADVFDVYGKPPAVLNGLSRAQTVALRRYVDGVARKVYRIAYDNGMIDAFCKASVIATNELKAQRERMLNSRRLRTR
jgi:hypothetical protein